MKIKNNQSWFKFIFVFGQLETFYYLNYFPKLPLLVNFEVGSYSALCSLGWLPTLLLRSELQVYLHSWFPRPLYMDLLLSVGLRGCRNLNVIDPHNLIGSGTVGRYGHVEGSVLLWVWALRPLLLKLHSI